MSLYSVPSNSHGNLDEQIDQLMQCKPLSEQEVTILLLYWVVNVNGFVDSCCFGGNFWVLVWI
ncbi:hypothetical protein SLEP1_g13138 [Rubroshorea leprosula]|uniref:Uncharacterized protein n=1 Tax=Rubroshorea leprosula TaxID=152421 RepID=A0AAV5IKK2_9ROSI|nr:hypothetical protein SLEP1_g13138 [Rubroshorea leprosula]